MAVEQQGSFVFDGDGPGNDGPGFGNKAGDDEGVPEALEIPTAEQWQAKLLSVHAQFGKTPKAAAASFAMAMICGAIAAAIIVGGIDPGVGSWAAIFIWASGLFLAATIGFYKGHSITAPYWIWFWLLMLAAGIMMGSMVAIFVGGLGTLFFVYRVFGRGFARGRGEEEERKIMAETQVVEAEQVALTGGRPRRRWGFSGLAQYTRNQFRC